MPVVFPAQERQGSFTSGSLQVLSTATWEIKLTDIPIPDDRRDPNKSIDYRIERYRDGVWKPWIASGWRGHAGVYLGRTGIEDDDPRIGVTIAAGETIRVHLEVPNAVTFGVVAEEKV